MLRGKVLPHFQENQGIAKKEQLRSTKVKSAPAELAHKRKVSNVISFEDNTGKLGDTWNPFQREEDFPQERMQCFDENTMDLKRVDRSRSTKHLLEKRVVKHPFSAYLPCYPKEARILSGCPRLDGKSRGRDGVRTTDLLVSKFALEPLRPSRLPQPKSLIQLPITGLSSPSLQPGCGQLMTTYTELQTTRIRPLPYNNLRNILQTLQRCKTPHCVRAVHILSNKTDQRLAGIHADPTILHVFRRCYGREAWTLEVGPEFGTLAGPASRRDLIGQQSGPKSQI
ncbi:hypothetical protein T265_10379 [Opisthorchis viverrini]|uniref:Uncharacterized protein n=1 Tax=Opisthorchis viverrini TaxID=6198 RepID=A0A074Z2Q8_OPIVI|nr:hypothetical protein T265_10379 [Opisthorchis viverrini]KER21253.1 hypothetical protein T265_10379 [Opisthorchis viverrini]